MVAMESPLSSVSEGSWFHRQNSVASRVEASIVLIDIFVLQRDWYKFYARPLNPVPTAKTP
jgi:hypothetical protein